MPDLDNERELELKSNLREVLEQIESQTQKLSCKKPQLIAVSKNFQACDIQKLTNCKQFVFGENKVQELSQKEELLDKSLPIEWHFIGHLQSNKIKNLLKVKRLKAIHSIDRLSLLQKLLKIDLEDKNQQIELFLQVNTSGEIEKGGFSDVDSLLSAANLIASSENFKLAGLMTIGKIRTESFEKDARESFLKLDMLKNSLCQKLASISSNVNSELRLSMGMSSDFQIAMEYNTDYIRVGTAIFGKRN